MSEVGKLYILFDADGKPYIKGLKDIEGKTSSTASHLEKTMGKAGKVMSQALAGGAVLAVAAIGSIAVASVKAAASFEYEMSRIKAVSGATAAEFESLRQLTLQLGKDTVFSAGEAAQAINELAKAGISVNDILGGAASATLALASAGELDVARAAEIAANSMNMFGLAGKDVMGVADALASAANASSLEVNDLAEAFKFIGPVANQMGISFQQVIAMIAELGNQGIKGEAAGTGLRTMLMSLAAPSAIASKAMEQYGVSAYDATGKIKPVPELLDHLKAQLQGLTQQQQMGLLEKVFGREGASASLILIGQGSEKLAEMQAIVSKTGEASRVAATKLDNLMGSWEQLKGSAETLAISIGTKALPMIRGFVDEMTEILNEAIETGDFTKAGEKIGQLIADGIEATAPYAAKAAGVVIQGALDAFGNSVLAPGLDWLTGGSQFQGDNSFERWKNYLSDRLSKYTAEGVTDAWAKASADLKNKEGIYGILERDYFGEPSGEQLLALARSQGLILTWEDLKEVQSQWGVTPAQAAQFYSAQQAETQRALLDKLAGIGTSSGGWGRNEADALRGGGGWNRVAADAFGVVDAAASSAAKGVGEFNEAIAQTPEQIEATKAAVDSLTGSISGMLDDQTAMNDSIKEGTLNLETYLEEVQKQIDAEANWEKNIRKISAKFGAEFGPEVMQAAAKKGAVYVAALAGADDATVRKTLGQLQTIMERESPGYVEQIYQEIGALSGDKAAIAALTAAGEYSKSFWAELTKKMGGGYQGWLKSLTYMGLAPFSAYGRAAGGATAAEIMKSFALQQGAVGGLAGSTGNVWTSLHSIFPNATWMGGYATSGHVTNSDHYTGHAFDTGGSPALMQAMANLLARNMEAWGLKYVIYNRQVNRGGGWVPYAGSNPHTDHVHVSTYDQGGVLPPGLTLASNFTGQNEVVVPASLTLEIQNLIKTLEKSALMGAFSGRSSLAGSYISRESARYGMYEAQGAPIELLESTLMRKIELINAAVAEAQAQLDAAKAQALPAEEINQLAESLFGLKTDAAGAQKQLEELARVPLDKAAAMWGSALSQTNTLMDLLGNSSNALSLQSKLFPQLMGQMGGGYQSSLDLMNASKNPEDIMQYGSSALSGLSGMFGAEKALMAQAQTEWERAWQKRGDALQAEFDREQKLNDQKLSDLDKAQTAEMDRLTTFYDDQISALSDQQKAIQEERTTGDLQEQIREIEGQQGKTEADIRRLHDLKRQLARAQEDITLERRMTGLQDERTAAVDLLTEQQTRDRDLLTAQIQANSDRLEQQRIALDAEKTARDIAYQGDIDALVTKYADMMKTVMDQESVLLDEAGKYANAGSVLGTAFADALVAAVTAGVPVTSFDAFMPTLLRPLGAGSGFAASMDTAGPQTIVVHRHEVVLSGDSAQQESLPELARLVAREIESDIKAVSFSYGRTR